MQPSYRQRVFLMRTIERVEEFEKEKAVVDLKLALETFIAKFQGADIIATADFFYWEFMNFLMKDEMDTRHREESKAVVKADARRIAYDCEI